MSLTRAQRKAIREAGPYRFDDEGVLLGGVFEVAFDQEWEDAVLSALNAIAGEDDAVVRTREALLRSASRGWDYSVTTSAADDYYEALRAAKKTRKT